MITDTMTWTMAADGPRSGEVQLAFDPADRADAGVTFIGRVRSPWAERSDCPKNLREARERGGGGWVELDAAYWPGLEGLEAGRVIVLLYWMDRAARNLIVQAPRHRDTPTGVFALRSPARPNPVALAAVRLLAVDAAAGRLEIDAIDCLDGTPLVDIKPWIESVDIPPA